MEHTIDAKGEAIGRVAGEVARLLRGKDRPTFAPNAIPRDKVTVVNAGAVKITGLKLSNKVYYRHSGYPGALKSETLEEVITKKGAGEALRRAVYGMLPNNRLRRIMMNNLKIQE
ncbi:MAG: 50S ribosomal protein L13 [Candidatus Paceibacterota bacterium]